MAQRQYLLFRDNPGHPSLRFKPINQARTIYSIRFGIGYRALGKIENNGADIVWFWIGSHADYDKLIGG